jgi:hypothetical protein
MVRTLLLLDEVALFMFASMYFGTGWSTVLFSYQVVPELTVENYYLQFVPQVTMATRVFTALTTLMIAAGVAMLVGEWGTGLVWVPAVVVVLVIVSATFTVRMILPINRRMREGITDPDELAALLRRWKRLNNVRFTFWNAEWISLGVFFAVRART